MNNLYLNLDVILFFLHFMLLQEKKFEDSSSPVKHTVQVYPVATPSEAISETEFVILTLE